MTPVRLEPATLRSRVKHSTPEPLCSLLSACLQSEVGSDLDLYSKTCLKQPLKKKTKIDFQDRLSLNAGQKYCRMLPLEHSAILLTFIKLPFAIKTFVLSILSGRLRQVLL